MPRLHGVALATLVAATLGACSDDDDGVAPGARDARRPVVEEIAPAIEALEAELGGPQQYFEVNATVQFVNLFVALDGATQVRGYVYVDDALGPPAPAEGAQGVTFAAADVTFDADAILDGVGEELPDSAITVFSVIEGPADEPQYTATVESDQGGILDVTLSADGSVAEVVPVRAPG